MSVEEHDNRSSKPNLRLHPIVRKDSDIEVHSERQEVHQRVSHLENLVESEEWTEVREDVLIEGPLEKIERRRLERCCRLPSPTLLQRCRFGSSDRRE